jgi:hypothetical protein
MPAPPKLVITLPIIIVFIVSAIPQTVLLILKRRILLIIRYLILKRV